MSETVHLERRLSPEECQHLCEDASEALNRNDFPLARELFESARKHDPFSWRPIQGLARAAFGENRMEDAWALTLAAFEAAPDDAGNAELLQKVAARVSKEADATERLSQAARRYPDAAHLAAFRPTLTESSRQALELCGKGEELLSSELWREAMFPFLEALDKDPQNADAWSGLGISCWRQNFRTAGLECFRRSMHLAPCSEDCVLNFAEALCRSGKGDRLIGELLGSDVPRELCSRVLTEVQNWNSAS